MRGCVCVRVRVYVCVCACVCACARSCLGVDVRFRLCGWVLSAGTQCVLPYPFPSPLSVCWAHGPSSSTTTKTGKVFNKCRFYV